MEKILSAFSFARLQESVTIYRTLQVNGFTMEDLVEYIKERLHKGREVHGNTEWEAVAPLCPECNGYLSPPKHICKKKGPENLKGWTCLWFCNSGDCVYEKYTHEDAAEEMKKLMEKGRKE